MTTSPTSGSDAASGNLLEAALDYAAAGLPVLPLDGKVPRNRGGLTNASTDVAIVADWWRRWPTANIGIRTGATSGYVVLDVDVPAGLRSLKQHGEPTTAAVLTGSGGYHHWFRYPGRDVRNSAGRLGDGLDVRGDGGYAVVPPSVHATGRPYKWLRPLEQAEDCPAWLLDEPVQPRNGASPVTETIPEGQRRQTLLSLAGSMRRRGMDRDELLAALTAVNERRCRPPLPADEVGRLAGDVAARYDPDPHEKAFPAPIEIGAAGNETKDAPVFAPVPLGSLLENVPPEPAWVLRGYLAPFALTLIAGRPKVGKSTTVFALVAQLVAGAPFAGVETVPAGVLMLTEERRDTIAEKARIFGLVSFPAAVSPIAPETNRPVHVVMRHDAPRIAWPELVRHAITYCHQHDLSVLIVDTWDRWTNLRGDSENAAGAVNEALEPLQYAAASGLAVAIVTHQRKSLGEFGEAVRGSNALTGGVDIVVELERPSPSLRLSKHARAVRAVSRFSATPDELYVELDEDANAFVAIDSPEAVKAAAERDQIAAALIDLGGGTSKEVADKAELPDRNVRRYLAELLESGHATRTGEGKRNDPYRWHPVDNDEADVA